MNVARGVVGVLGLWALGCQGTPPPPSRSAVSIPAPAPVVRTQPMVPLPAVIALVEPYLVAESPHDLRSPSPPPLRGHILPDTPVAPLSPLPPAGPIPRTSAPPATVAPAPRRSTIVPAALVKLLEDERAKSVEEARRRLAAASARATQTAAEAKRLWGYVREGFVAQKQADAADAASHDATAEQADAQKALEAAQARQRDARKDVEAAFRSVALVDAYELTQADQIPRAYQPVPFTFRLSVLGESPTTVRVEGGTLGRRLPTAVGEAGAWIVRAADPSRLRVTIAGRSVKLVVRSLPSVNSPPTV